MAIGQLSLLFGLIGIAGSLIVAIIPNGAFSTVLLFILVSAGGLLLCRRTEINLSDPSLRALGYLWLAKLLFSLLLLYVGWIPQLDPATSEAWGYDPQRFYIEAQRLTESGWSADFVNLNYVGILYYYGALFYVVGHNPVAPALANAFVTLTATLYLVRVGYEIKAQRSPRDWMLGCAMLLPEVLWFDTMTSRETLVGALLLGALLSVGRYVARTAPVSFLKAFSVSAPSILAIAVVRTSMLLPVFGALILMVAFVKRRNGSRMSNKALVAFAATAMLVTAPALSAYVGGYGFDVMQSLRAVTSSEGGTSISDASGWSQNSIGMLLLPQSLFQSALFIPLRLMLYWVAPLPNITVRIGDLLGGSWFAWQQLCLVSSSLVSLGAIPLVWASALQSIRKRRSDSGPLVFQIPYWATFTAIAGGNLVIHERYRVMASLLMWGCAWLGASTCPRPLLIRCSVAWFGLLALGALFYVLHKGM